MNVLALDTEVTTWNKGNAFDSRNSAVCFSWADNSGSRGARLFREQGSLEFLREQIAWADLLVGFNFKFDYHWFRKEGIDLSNKLIRDTQTGYYIWKRQTVRWPSLEECAAEFNLGHKLDIIKTEYWDKGINTDEIPWDVLQPYAIQDAVLTLELFFEIQKRLTPKQTTLWSLSGQDLHVLAEMEWNGLYYNKDLCETRAAELGDQIDQIKAQLASVYPDVPINFNSGDDLSAFLYGGVVTQTVPEHIGFYKTGLKAGQPKFKNTVVEHRLPRLVTPLPGTELKKEGFFATNEPTLRKLRGARKYIDLILTSTKLDTLRSKYYVGLPKKATEMHWEPEGILHGSFHQISTATGRLSSSDPNLQNQAGDIEDIFITRF
ncbi:MAG: hypothetical protein KGI54_15440 [Pseudomonadota bacterium]|nr:hypothetical protein [Pseudomonadota bacterium]